ncbi:MAG: MOSC domain-containing protein [Pseudomonadota bacterium]
MNDRGGGQASLSALTGRFAIPGRVRWIGVRPERRADLLSLDQVEIALDGLVGDRRNTPGKRAVSLLQWEHLPVIASLLGHADLQPRLLRRNIVVSGINLLGLRKRTFRVGGVLLRGSGICAPCSRMEEALGHGGYTAVRGHGGITAEVVTTGTVHLGDTVSAAEGSESVLA